MPQLPGVTVEQAHLLAADQTAESLASDRQRRDALLWNFTVLGEAAAQLPDNLKACVSAR